MDYWQTVTNNFKDLNWHHLVMVVDKINLKQNVYYDGVKQGTPMTIVNADNSTASNFTLGKTGTQFFNGLIDEVRIYNAAIPSAQIRENYLAGLNKLLANNAISVVEYNQRLVEFNKSVAEQ